ncbi:glycerol-3-phosphate phosphatase-like isoform X2 [Corticium candelabrum]|uniref:glycerol-3-phosphate phosphatase-like isoform X2 n=1 Tax=Corticium candelabrum TaxID=121492 RepID=UPI002E2532DC|nr:glycerol-3-phosphate phosphatase-like isoform X2 [Corticium candelabrum]
MMKAASYLFNPNCIFIGTNEDAFLPVPKGHITIPGTGCLVAAVAMAAQRSPIYIGKPHKPMFELLQKKHGLDPGRTCMIGDSLKSDIRFGFNNNLLTLLVLSGATKKEQFNELQKRSAEADWTI